MTFVPIMFSVWGALILFFVAVKVYAGRVGRDEEDQIMLSDSSSQMKAEQDAIAARVNRLVPVQRTALILMGAMTLFVAGYYVLDIMRQLGF
jgi:hypothetical protein